MSRSSSSTRSLRYLLLLLCAASMIAPLFLKRLPKMRRWLATSEIGTDAACGRTQALAAALQAGGDPNSRTSAGEPPLLLAAHNGHTDCVHLLLEYGANPNSRGSDGTPLIHAVRNSHVEIVRDLLRHGADPNLASNRCTPLTMAAWVGSRQNVHLLIEHGADPTKSQPDGLTPLQVALKENYPDIANYLLQVGARK